MASGLPDVLSWWADPGRAGWYPDAWDCANYPLALAGLALGGARVSEPGAAPGALPEPGVAAARRALPWSDSVAVEVLAGAGWGGFGTPLAEARASSESPGAGRARAVLQLIEGDNGYESDGLGFRRGDERDGLGVEMVTGIRGAVGAFEGEGRHLWGLEAHRALGPHRVEVAYAQRGTGERLAGGEEQNAAGESGNLGYRWDTRHGTVALELARGYAHHESYGGTLAAARRDAGEDRAALELAGTAGGAALGLRAEWRQAAAARVIDGKPEFDRRVSLQWVAGRMGRALAGGRLELRLGVGHDGGSDRTEAAPALEYRFGGSSLSGRLSAARLLLPVWSDLAAGEQPFLQSTWAAGGELAAARSGARRGEVRTRLFGFAGRTDERALAARLPFEELWLRAGLRADPARYRFALGGIGAEARWGVLAAGGEGFLLGRDRDGAQPQVDPSWGARAFAGGRFALFEGDLGLVIRGEVEWIGERETEEAIPRALPAIARFGVAAVLTLADATLTFKVRNLTDKPQAQTWIDSATGAPALSPGREVRGMLTWRLFD